MPMRSMPGMPDMLLAARAAQSQHLVREQNARRQRARTQHAREHRRQTIGVSAVGVVLAVALAGGVYFGVVSPALQSTSVEKAKTKAKTDAFAQTRAGRIFVPVDGGGFCRSLQFNNQTGETSNLGLVDCEEVSAKTGEPPPTGGRGYVSFSESFKNR